MTVQWQVTTAKQGHMFIGDLNLRKIGGEPITIKLRIGPRPRQPPYIGYDAVVSIAQNLNKFFDAAVRVTDREEGFSA